MKILEFILNYWDVLVGIVFGIISLISTIVVAIKNKNWSKICEVVKEAVSKAEKFTNYTGEEKKNYVMTLANQYAISKNIKFNSEKVSNFIEELVALSKEVNAREKDKTTTK